MSTGAKLEQGTTAWFEMVGALLCEAAVRARLSPTLNLSLVERYADGITMPNGLVQGLRFDISAGTPSFRVGVRPDELADVRIEVTAAAAKVLNTLRSTDPEYPAAVNRYLDTGEMRVDGDLTPLGAWFADTHDLIVDRTINFGAADLRTEDQGE
ncbi:MAG: hypothetical protein ACSHYC_01465 [Alphaproteobacteria bacterium]